jgi:hypothetical protein
VTLCHPKQYVFSSPQPSQNQPVLASRAILRFGAENRLDHDRALRYVADRNRAYCDYELAEGYNAQFVEVGGWPAMEQSYTEPAPVCGACDPPPMPEFLMHAKFFLAAGSIVVSAYAAADPANAAHIEEAFSIVGTLRVDSGETPASTSADLDTLAQFHQAECED